MSCPACGYSNKPGARICNLCQCALSKLARMTPSTRAAVIAAGRVQRDMSIVIDASEVWGRELSAAEVQGLLVDARARIAWGRSPEGVESWLVQQGLPSTTAREAVLEARRERDRAFRAAGLRDLVIGAIALLILVGLVAAAKNANGIVIPRHPGAFVGLGALVIAGPGLMARGIFRLIQGGRTDGALPD